MTTTIEIPEVRSQALHSTERLKRDLQPTRPRLAFLGVGWIGRKRMEAIAQADIASVVALVEPSDPVRAEAAQVAPNAVLCRSIEELEGLELDGLIIATPSAFHAEQTLAALQRGWAVFCQKPLGRNAEEVRAVVRAARAADRLLAVDLSYRFVTEVVAVRDRIASGALGQVFAVDLVFHNAYGPDKAWYYDGRLSGGGCVMDLGIHLVDCALWCLGFPQVEAVTSRLFSAGQPLRGRGAQIEDYATARLDLNNGATIDLACSWRASAGCDAIIQGVFYGTEGGATFRNLNGSFYHFAAEEFHGTKRHKLAATTEPWGGRAALEWVRRLARGSGYDPNVETAISTAEILDLIYASS